ncbi:anti-repressor SinI family protein [Ornithinibacillus xuwenensis]|uniref:Anti-repressor SinI family protein n=1 Tax=Ornithinibacillus xuwenensis TaxID=3144668 RepID=A0ABU9XKD1_9BACI
MNKTVTEVNLDYEWVALIREAKAQGMSVEEIRIFLSEAIKNT